MENENLTIEKTREVCRFIKFAYDALTEYVKNKDMTNLIEYSKETIKLLKTDYKDITKEGEKIVSITVDCLLDCINIAEKEKLLTSIGNNVTVN